MREVREPRLLVLALVVTGGLAVIALFSLLGGR